MMVLKIMPNENSQNECNMIIIFIAPFSNFVINLSTIIKYVLKKGGQVGVTFCCTVGYK